MGRRFLRRDGAIGVQRVSAPLTINTTLDDTYDIVICNASGTITVTLPPKNGRQQFWIKNRSSYAVTIVPDGAETIDGVTAASGGIILGQYDAVMLVDDNVEWSRFSQNAVKFTTTNPNTSPGLAGELGMVAIDTTNKIPYLCTTRGAALTAVWSVI